MACSLWVFCAKVATTTALTRRLVIGCGCLVWYSVHPGVALPAKIVLRLLFEPTFSSGGIRIKHQHRLYLIMFSLSNRCSILRPWSHDQFSQVFFECDPPHFQRIKLHHIVCIPMRGWHPTKYGIHSGLR